MFEPPHAAFVAGAPRFDPLANPRLFLREHLVELGVLGAFDFEFFGLATAIRGVASRITREPSAIEFGDARRHLVEKGAIVRDEDHAAGELDQQRFEPRDGFDVEVVGRLVEQQQVGLDHHRARERDALALAARQIGDARIGVELEAGHHAFETMRDRPAVDGIERALRRSELVHRLVGVIGCDAMRGVLVGNHQRSRGQAARHGFEHVGIERQRRLLLDQRHRDARGARDASIVWIAQARDQRQQRRFARTVAPDQADALTALDMQRNVVEQCDVSECEFDAGKGEEGHEGASV